MANKPAPKKPAPKSGGAGKKAKATSTPSDTAKEEPNEEPPFTKDVSDLNLED
jgi:hypothetical protein